jgi:hypothetical protein
LPKIRALMISNWITSEFPLRAAQCSGVLLLVVRALTDAPFSISKSTVSEFPPAAAQCSEVVL